MAKIYGLNGRYVGKMGGQVFSLRAGQQLSRAYNGHVRNRSTERQVAARAKFKLLSQISAIFADVIAIPSESGKSPRNLFIKKNYNAVEYENETAKGYYEAFQLTNGVRDLPYVSAQRESNQINIALIDDASAIVDRVIYVIFKKTLDEKLQLLSSTIVEEAGNNGTFPLSINGNSGGEMIIYAYGMKDANEQATAKYYDYNVESVQYLVTLVSTRTITSGDASFTRTSGTTFLES